MESKPIIRSKTFWINALVGTMASADYIVGSGVLGPKASAVAVPALAAINIFMRTVTGTPVTLK